MAAGGRLRDFSEGTRRDILAKVRQVEGHRQGFIAVNAMLDPGGEFYETLSLFNYYDVREYYRHMDYRLIEIRNMVHKVWSDVYVVDRGFAAKMRAGEGEALVLASVLGSLADALSPSAAGTYPIEMPEDDFRALLGGAVANLTMAALGQVVELDADGHMVLGEDGKPIFNWDNIAEILDKPAGLITEAEYLALAMAFLFMDLEDSQRFVMLMADRSDREPYGPWAQDETYWDYDPEKVDRIKWYVDLIIYNTAYALEFDELTEEQAQLLRDKWKEMMPHSSLLGTLSGLRGLTGTDDTGPWITLDPSDNSYDYCVLRLHHARDVIVIDDHSVPPTLRTSYLPFYETTLTVSAARTDNQHYHQVTTDYDLEYFRRKYSGSLLDIANTVAFYGVDQAVSMATGWLVGEFLEGTPVGFPIKLGKFLLDKTLDFIIGRQQANRDMRDIETHIDKDNLTSLLLDFQIATVVTSDGSLRQGFAFYPTPDTRRMVAGLNVLVAREGIPVPEGLGYPIEVVDIFTHQEEFVELWRYTLDDEQRREVEGYVPNNEEKAPGRL
jgi:hypothetical protein